MHLSNKRTINGKEYRFNNRYKIMVCENGWGFFREYDNKYMLLNYGTYWLKRQEDKDGNIVVETRDFGFLRADELVATCFCPPKPADGEEYVLVHKDGKKENCSKWNLEWRCLEDEEDEFSDDTL